MKTSSYKPNQKTVEMPQGEAQEQQVTSAQLNQDNFDGHNISFLDQMPKVYSYKELNETHSAEDIARLERVRKLIFEIKKSPKYGADIMRGFVARNSKITRNQPLDQ